jgi:hypothetical protein
MSTLDHDRADKSKIPTCKTGERGRKMEEKLVANISDT